MPIKRRHHERDADSEYRPEELAVHLKPPSLIGIVPRGGEHAIRSAADLACGQLLKRVVVRSDVRGNPR
jgi:hypothetical protein